MFSRPEDKEFIEWSTLRVRDWLRYCRWYYGTALNDQVTIEDFFNAPVVNRNWKITRSDPQLQRFGLLWKVYDMVALKRLDWKVHILPEPSGSLPEPCLLGGVTGTDYLVVARGTNQPRAKGLPALNLLDSGQSGLVKDLIALRRATDIGKIECKVTSCLSGVRTKENLLLFENLLHIHAQTRMLENSPECSITGILYARLRIRS